MVWRRISGAISSSFPGPRAGSSLTPGSLSRRRPGDNSDFACSVGHLGPGACNAPAAVDPAHAVSGDTGLARACIGAACRWGALDHGRSARARHLPRLRRHAPRQQRRWNEADVGRRTRWAPERTAGLPLADSEVGAPTAASWASWSTAAAWLQRPYRSFPKGPRHRPSRSTEVPRPRARPGVMRFLNVPLRPSQHHQVTSISGASACTGRHGGQQHARVCADCAWLP